MQEQLSGVGRLHGLPSGSIEASYRIRVKKDPRTGLFSITGTVDLPQYQELEALNEDGAQTLELSDGRRVEARYFGQDSWRFNGLEGYDA